MSPSFIYWVTFKVRMFVLIFLLMSCRLTSPKNPSDILTLETSSALKQACQQERSTADLTELREAETALANCLEDALAVKKWSKKVAERIEMNWPRDFLARGDQEKACLQKLTRGVRKRYLDALLDGCLKASTPKQKRELLEAIKQRGKPPCFDVVSMTSEGCFEVKACGAGSLEPRYFGASDLTPRKQLILCSPSIQKIHGIKDPTKANLLYNYSYVSELTGNESSNRITYGPPNCHGVAQAAAGGLLDDLPLTSVRHARLANENRCKEQVTRFFETHKNSPISAIPMNPGGMVINMKYDDCQATDCGKASLWVDDCSPEKLDLAVFIDGMCVDCWEKKLGSKGLKRQPAHPSGRQLIPGCILTTQDHSVMLIEQSDGMCFFYEATSPYGPPQLRAVPCPVLNQKFSRQYCPDQENIEWVVK